MTDKLVISTLGPLNIELNGRTLTPSLSRKAQALLVYVACQPRPVARELLTTLLWADSSGEQGMTNLRKTLSEVRRWLPDHLLAERQNISLAQPFWLDVADLGRLLPAEAEAEPDMERLATAVSFYRGPFLADLFLPDCPDLMLWITLQREQVRQKVINALHTLANHCLRQRRYSKGVAYARQLVELEPLSEATSRTLMLLLARSGQAPLALAEYDRCRKQLRAELGVEPTAVTQSLHQRISTAVTARPTLPTPTVSFLGREAELTQINQYLADPTRRWLTITGPGGVGKTRLALHIATEWAYDFLHGVHFVSLAAIDSAATLATTLATAVNAPLAGPEPPQQQLLNYLRQKELLLLVDNGELLLSPGLDEAADMLSEVLQHAPQVRLLVTSRERFNYQAEQVIALAGLPVDDETSLQLFGARARQVQPDFAITPETRPAVEQICRLVDGLPLGIELAAASLATYSPAEIATGLTQTLDFLQREEAAAPGSGRRDGRHHSLRAVFESAWEHLAADEQTTMTALSIFPGSFTALAALAIAQATPPLLLALVDKSMLRVMGERYQLHQLLRQFAAEKVAEGTAVQTRFGLYFAHFLQGQAGRLHGREQQQTLQAIDAETDNIRAAWRWLVENGQTAAISQALSPLHHFYDMRGRFAEGEASFRLAAEQYQATGRAGDDQIVLGRLLARQGFFLERMGRLESATHHLQTGLTLLEGTDATEEAFVLSHLGLVVYNQGAYEEAEAYCRRSLELSRQVGAADQEASTLLNLSALLREQGDYPAARQLVEESLTLLQQGGDARQLAIGLKVLGSLAETEGDFAAANAYFQQSLVICQEIDDRMGQAVVCSSLCQIARQQQALPEAQAWGQQALALFQEIGDLWGIAISSVRLGELALAQTDYAGARKLFQTALELCQEMGDQRGTAVCLCNLGYVALAVERLAKAGGVFHQAIKIAASIQFMPLLLKAIAGMAQLYDQTGKTTPAITLTAFVQQHPATDVATRAQAAGLWQKLVGSRPLDSEPTTAPDLDAILELVEDVTHG